MKKVLGLLVLVIVFSLSACNDDTGLRVDDEPIVDDNNDDNNDLLQLTIAELSTYDGMDGNPAYIAVDGIVYDVSDSSRWSNGSHNGFYAGQDLTEEINNISPHGTSVLDGIPIVGEIVND